MDMVTNRRNADLREKQDSIKNTHLITFDNNSQKSFEEFDHKVINVRIVLVCYLTVNALLVHVSVSPELSFA